MRGAPPVALTCDGGLVWRAVQAFLPAAAAGALAPWLAGHGGLGVSGQAVAALVFAMAAAAWAWRASAPRPVALAWDGEQWRLGPAGAPGRVDVMIDLGGWLLLRHVGGGARGRASWLAVSAAAAGPALHGLRVALQAAAAAPAAGIDSPERQAR
jgi:hypothetical protein